jgi:hypothetical protein
MNTQFSGKVKKRMHKIQPKGAIFFTKLRKVIKFYKEFYKGCKIPQTRV